MRNRNAKTQCEIALQKRNPKSQCKNAPVNGALKKLKNLERVGETNSTSFQQKNIPLRLIQ
jgi:hypothetical protein